MHKDSFMDRLIFYSKHRSSEDWRRCRSSASVPSTKEERNGSIRTVTSLMFLLFSCGGAERMKKSALVFVMFFVSLVMLIPLEDVRAATITTGAMCTLVDAIESANTNAAVGGCATGSAGHDTIVVTWGVVLTAINNGSGSNANGLPVIMEDLTLRSAAPGIMRSNQRSTSLSVRFA